jgi:hypothetical protein
LWQIDCNELRETKRPFELHDVCTPEHESFVEVFASRYGWRATRQENKILFTPRS